MSVNQLVWGFLEMADLYGVRDIKVSHGEDASPSHAQPPHPSPTRLPQPGWEGGRGRVGVIHGAVFIKALSRPSTEPPYGPRRGTIHWSAAHFHRLSVTM